MKNVLDGYMKSNGSAPPAALGPLVGKPAGIQPDEITESSDTLLKGFSHSVRYFPPPSAHPNKYAISAVCQA